MASFLFGRHTEKLCISHLEVLFIKLVVGPHRNFHLRTFDLNAHEVLVWIFDGSYITALELLLHRIAEELSCGLELKGSRLRLELVHESNSNMAITYLIAYEVVNTAR